MNKKAKVINNMRYKEGTLSVRVVIKRRHKLYDKTITSSRNYLVHCESKSMIPVGTNVVIIQCKPYSKRKCWKILEEVNNGL